MKNLSIIFNVIIGTFFTFTSIFTEDTILAVIGVGMLINANTMICLRKKDANSEQSE